MNDKPRPERRGFLFFHRFYRYIVHIVNLRVTQILRHVQYITERKIPFFAKAKKKNRISVQPLLTLYLLNNRA